MKILCFEGIDGAGKTSQAAMLAENLRSAGCEVMVAKHPGHTEFGTEIRKLILGEAQPVSDLAHRLVFWADAVETVTECEKSGIEVLIFDRHPLFSNLAYGLGLLWHRKAGFEAEREYLRFCLDMAGVMKKYTRLPEATLIIDVPAEVSWERMAKRGELTVIEKRGVDYFRQVRNIYLKEVTALYPSAHVFDGTLPKKQLADEIFNFIKAKQEWSRNCVATTA